MAMSMSKSSFSLMVSPLAGNWNLDATILSLAKMSPMGVGLQEPPSFCWPSVRIFWEQKSTKLTSCTKQQRGRKSAEFAYGAWRERSSGATYADKGVSSAIFGIGSWVINLLAVWHYIISNVVCK